MKAKFRKLSLLSLLILLLVVFSLIVSTTKQPPVNQVKDTVSSASQTNPSPQSGSASTQIVSNEVQQQALSYYDQGLKLYYQKDFSEALSLFNKALFLNPKCYQALNGKGATYAFQGRYTEGIDLIKKALNLKPDYEYGYFNLGLANELASNWSDAISAYQTALKLDSHDTWAYYGIASIYGRQGNVDQTVNYLKQAIAIEPDARETAKTEHDFDPVRSSAEFQALLQQTPTSALQGNTDSSSKKNSLMFVLYYHSVLTEKGNPIRMPPEQFEEQMRFLAEHGYNVLTPVQLEQNLRGDGQFPPKPFLITFDDGYVDNYTNALPILQKYRFVATVFIVSSYINGSGFLSADQLRSLQSAGWTIGGHTATHLDLSEQKPDQITAELQTSRETLKSILGQDVLYFAYPYGKHNDTVIKKLQQEGYRMAFTTEKGWVDSRQNLFLLPRVYCYANMGMDEFIRRVTCPDY